MLAWMVLHLPLALVPIVPNPAPVTCQLDVLPPFVIEERVRLDFAARVDHYVRLHRRLERTLPPEHLFADLEDMPIAVDALHDAMIDARPNARAGTIFTPAVADALSRALERAITDNGYTTAEVLAAVNIGRRAGALPLEVNGRSPGVLDFKIWPALLSVLPELPPELEYRLVDRDLVLIDLHADLVVDILENALPSPAQTMISRLALH